MKKDLGYGYDYISIGYRNGLVEMNYSHEDLLKIWKEIKLKLVEDSGHVIRLKKNYEDNWRSYQTILDEGYREDISGLAEQELLDLFLSCIRALTESVGISHVIESIGQNVEGDFREILAAEIGLDAVKEHLAKLTFPTEKSFVTRSEEALKAIGTLTGEAREKAMNDYLADNYWIQNSYKGSVDLRPDLEKMVSEASLARVKEVTKEERDALAEKLGLSEKVMELMDLIDLTTIWQDQRKANILKTIHVVDCLVKEIAKRIGIDKLSLYQLGMSDIDNLKSLDQLKSIEADLKRRITGVYFIMTNDLEEVLVGDDYLEAHKLVKNDSDDDELDVLNGSIANPGLAVGRVKVCLDIETIDKVEIGDILVASMTRPEYMPAIKKAAAIITDEGGITCHAAIVARELGIPAIIGTKRATKVLKDGQLVEVRANHGQVRVIKEG